MSQSRVNKRLLSHVLILQDLLTLPRDLTQCCSPDRRLEFCVQSHLNGLFFSRRGESGTAAEWRSVSPPQLEWPPFKGKVVNTKMAEEPRALHAVVVQRSVIYAARFIRQKPCKCWRLLRVNSHVAFWCLAVCAVGCLPECWVAAWLSRWFRLQQTSSG